MGLGIRKGESETWLECAYRYVSSWNSSYAENVEPYYEKLISEGYDPPSAAYTVCYELDVIEMTDEDGNFPEELPDWLEPPPEE